MLVEQLNHDYVLQMLNWLKIRNSKFRRTPAVTFVAASVLLGSVLSPNATSVPAATKKLVSSLVAAQWQQVESILRQTVASYGYSEIRFPIQWVWH